MRGGGGTAPTCTSGQAVTRAGGVPTSGGHGGSRAAPPSPCRSPLPQISSSAVTRRNGPRWTLGRVTPAATPALPRPPAHPPHEVRGAPLGAGWQWAEQLRALSFQIQAASGSLGGACIGEVGASRLDGCHAAHRWALRFAGVSACRRHPPTAAAAVRAGHLLRAEQARGTGMLAERVGRRWAVAGRRPGRGPLRCCARPLSWVPPAHGFAWLISTRVSLPRVCRSLSACHRVVCGRFRRCLSTRKPSDAAGRL